jgi:malonyl CoA-acyl carrier protein transacylase
MLRLVKLRADVMSAVFKDQICRHPSPTIAQMAVIVDSLSGVQQKLNEFKELEGRADYFIDISISNSPRKTFVSGDPHCLREVCAI